MNACPTCRGTGRLGGFFSPECAHCDGDGVVAPVDAPDNTPTADPAPVRFLRAYLRDHLGAGATWADRLFLVPMHVVCLVLIPIGVLTLISAVAQILRGHP